MDVIAVYDQVGDGDMRTLYNALFWHLHDVADGLPDSFEDLWGRLNRLFAAPAFPTNPRQKLAEWQEWIERTPEWEAGSGTEWQKGGVPVPQNA
jgi:hypothetical protein